MMNRPFDGVFNDLPVLVTGHTGFKGSWLSIWLNELGANVIGYSLEPPTKPSNFQLSQLAGHVTDVRGDVRDFETLRQAIERYQPRAVFHLAAQPIVLESYREPKETFTQPKQIADSVGEREGQRPSVEIAHLGWRDVRTVLRGHQTGG